MAISERSVENIGHGGAGDFYPGNSRHAIEQALRIGVDRIEFDVQRSGSGDLVLVHDERVRMLNGLDARVKATSTEEIRRALPGLLTLGEVVELIGHSAKLLIDVKAPGYESDLISEIRRLEIQSRAAISSTHASVLWKLRKSFPAMRIGLSTGHLATGISLKSARKLVSFGLQIATPLPLLKVVQAVGATDVMIQYRICSPHLVTLMHRHGIQVNTWTVDHPKQIARVLDMGVDGIISNRPDLVQAALGEGQTRIS